MIFVFSCDLTLNSILFTSDSTNQDLSIVSQKQNTGLIIDF